MDVLFIYKHVYTERVRDNRKWIIIIYVYSWNRWACVKHNINLNIIRQYNIGGIDFVDSWMESNLVIMY